MSPCAPVICALCSAGHRQSDATSSLATLSLATQRQSGGIRWQHHALQEPPHHRPFLLNPREAAPFRSPRIRRLCLCTIDFVRRSLLGDIHHTMKYSMHIIGFTALLLAAGCASTSNLPSGARRVGGGLQIDWRPPADGTAILVETTTGRTIATQSVSVEGNVGFNFDVTREQDAAALKALFPTMPTNAQFVLYFVPSAKKQ